MREIKLTENQKSTDKKKKDWEFRKIIKREKEKISKPLGSLYFSSCNPALSPFVLVLHFQAWSPLRWMTV